MSLNKSKKAKKFLDIDYITDHDDPTTAKQYAFCCGFGWHVRICATIVGVIELCALTIYFLTTIVMYAMQDDQQRKEEEGPLQMEMVLRESKIGSTASDDESTSDNIDYHDQQEMHRNITWVTGCFFRKSTTALAICVIFFFMGILVIGLMLSGIIKTRAVYVVPHLIGQVITILALCGILIYYFLKTRLFEKSSPEKSGGSFGAYCLAVLILISAMIAAQIYFTYVVWRCYKYLKEKMLYERLRRRVPYDYQMGSYRQQKPLMFYEYDADQTIRR